MTRKHIKSLYVFDIDDTLFQTTARAKVTNDEGKVKYLNSRELKKTLRSRMMRTFLLKNLRIQKSLLQNLNQSNQ